MPFILSSSNASAIRATDATGLKFELSKNSRQLIRVLEEQPKEDLVVIGEDVELDDAIFVAERMRIDRPSLSVILIRSRLEMTQVRQAMAAGVANVILQSDGAGLSRACQQALLIAKEIRRTSGGEASERENYANVLLVYSAKGGVGKTTLATNIAGALSKNLGKRVCLLDFDLQFGDVGVALGMEHTRSISDALPEREDFSTDQALGLVLNYKPNFDVLLAPLTPVFAEEISEKLAHNIIDKLRPVYDFLVIDSPPAFTDVILEAFDMSDTYYFVTTSDSPSLKNLALAFETLRKIGLSGSKCHVLVNRFSPKAGVTETEIRELVVKLTGVRDITFLPDAKEILKTSNSGIPVVFGYPKSKIAKAITAVASQAVNLASETRGTRLPK